MFCFDQWLSNFMYFLVQFSVRENLLVVTGNPETKELKDLMPEILKQVGVQQYNYLKNIIGNMDTVKESKVGEEDEDDVPDLVGTNFDEASKKWEQLKAKQNASSYAATGGWALLVQWEVANLSKN